MDSNQAPQNLSEASAIRLFNSVAATDETIGLRPITIIPHNQNVTMTGQKSIESVESIDEFGNSCRICRWNRRGMEIVQSPCLCKGTVGFLHLQCLKRWIMHRRNIHCEICNAPFVMPVEKFSIGLMAKNFFSQCAGSILKHILFSASLVPLGHVILQQVLFCMEDINQSPHEHLTISEILVASCSLLTSSALFFHFFEFVTTRMLLVRSILRQWWNFGNTSDFPLVQLDSGIFLDFF